MLTADCRIEMAYIDPETYTSIVNHDMRKTDPDQALPVHQGRADKQAGPGRLARHWTITSWSTSSTIISGTSGRSRRSRRCGGPAWSSSRPSIPLRGLHHHRQGPRHLPGRSPGRPLWGGGQGGRALRPVQQGGGGEVHEVRPVPLRLRGAHGVGEGGADGQQPQASVPADGPGATGRHQRHASRSDAASSTSPVRPARSCGARSASRDCNIGVPRNV